MKGELLFKIIGGVDDDLIKNVQICSLAKEDENETYENCNDIDKE